MTPRGRRIAGRIVGLVALAGCCTVGLSGGASWAVVVGWTVVATVAAARLERRRGRGEISDTAGAAGGPFSTGSAGRSARRAACFVIISSGIAAVILAVPGAITTPLGAIAGIGALAVLLVATLWLYASVWLD